MESNKFMRYNNNNMVKLDEDELECLRKLGDNHRQQTDKKVEKSRNFGNGYDMVRLDEDELECLRKLGDNNHRQQKTNKKVEKSRNFGNGYDMVRLDEDELECLRKLGDSHRQHKIVDNSIDYNVVRLDEDELECLRKLGDQHDQHTVGPNKYKMVSIDEVDEDINNNASVVRPFSSKGSMMTMTNKKKKLESKKSEDINESAEKFIQKFKQQLILQRLESIENVDKMLARGL